MVTAVLGHNGAGKTTLFNMLTGMLPITHGDCYIFGHSITDASTDARRNIGMCPQHNVLWDDLTCYEHLVYFAMVKGLLIMQCSKAADEMLERVDLASKRNARSASLSGSVGNSSLTLCLWAGVMWLRAFPPAVLFIPRHYT